jgi:hypothetical protein
LAATLFPVGFGRTWFWKVKKLGSCCACAGRESASTHSADTENADTEKAAIAAAAREPGVRQPVAGRPAPDATPTITREPRSARPQPLLPHPAVFAPEKVPTQQPPATASCDSAEAMTLTISAKRRRKPDQFGADTASPSNN